MNKTYRIKYNQHTGAYVAVAEISTVRGKSGGSGRLVAAALLAAGLSISSTAAWADPWGTGMGASWNPSVTEGVVEGTWGCNNAATSQTVYDANGNPFFKSYPANSGHEGAWLEGNRGVVLGGGCDNIAVAMQDAVAIGNGAAASVNAVAIGNMALAKGVNSVAIGANALANGTNMVAIGADSGQSSRNVSRSSFVGIYSGYDANNVSSSSFVGYGSGISANNVSRSSFVGTGSGYDAKNVSSSSFVGDISGSDANNVSSSSFVGDRSGMHANNVRNGNFMGVFSGAWSQGENNNLLGTASGMGLVGDGNVALGNAANSLKVYDAQTRQFKDRTGTISTSNPALGLSANNTVALGALSLSLKDNGVALGSGAIANTAAGQAGYLAGGKTDAVWQATLAAVSVGGDDPYDGKNVVNTRQITNVAAGTTLTDAVNVAQLQAVEAKIGSGTGSTLSNLHFVSVQGNPTDGNYGNDGASGLNAIAIGANALAIGAYSVAQGHAANAAAENSVAMGNGAVASAANSISLGLGAGASVLPMPITPLGNNNNIGTYAGNASIQMNSNLIGNQAGLASAGLENNYIGSNSGAGVNGADNVAIGRMAGTEVVAVLNAGTTGAMLQLRSGGSVPGFLPGTAGNVNQTVSIGDLSLSRSSSGVALGSNAIVEAGYTGSMALGAGSRANAAGSLALGAGSETSRANTVSVGKTGAERQITNVADGTTFTDAVNLKQLQAAVANASGSHFVSIKGDTTDGNYNNNGASGTNAIAIGANAEAAGGYSIAQGYGAKTVGAFTQVAIGTKAQAMGDGVVSIGPSAGSYVNDWGGVYVGSYAGNNAKNTSPLTFVGQVGIGMESLRNSDGRLNAMLGAQSGYGIQGEYNTGVGSFVGTASQGNHNAYAGTGAGAYQQGNNNIAMGSGAGSEYQLVYSGAYSSSNGTEISTSVLNRQGQAVSNPTLQAAVSNTVALGDLSLSRSSSGVALGSNAIVEAGFTGSMALGAGSRANALNSLALGAGSETSRANTVSVGKVGSERQITNVADGTTFTDAVNLKQLQAVQALIGSGSGGTQSSINFFSVDGQATDGNYGNDGASGLNAIAIGANALASGDYSLAQGHGAQALEANTVAIGSFAGFDARGQRNNFIGVESGYWAEGDQNTFVGDSSGRLAMGNNNSTFGFNSGDGVTGDRNTFVGNNAGVFVHGDGNVALGDMAGSLQGFDWATNDYTDRQGSNTQNSLIVSNTVALGTLSLSLKDDGVALGSGAIANTAAGQVGYLAGGKTDATWKATLASVSVGGDDPYDGKNTVHTRQITNVAAGTTLTDAVNVAQLQAAVANIPTVNFVSIQGNKTDGNYNNNGASGTNAIAIGANAEAAGNYSIALGDGAKAVGSFTQIAIGTKAQSLGEGMVSIGSSAGSGVNDWGGVYVGSNAGNNAKNKPNSLFVGQVGIGMESLRNSTGRLNAMLGAQSGSGLQGEYNTGVGSFVGTASQGNNNSYTGRGAGAYQQGDNNIAIGNGAGSEYQLVLSGAYSSYYGAAIDTSVLNRQGQSVTNPTLQAAVSNTVALGDLSWSRSSSGVALGSNAIVEAGFTGSMALGAGSRANALNSLALGAGSETSRANTVSVGKTGAERQITNVADGTTFTDAVNLKQLQAVQALIGTGSGGTLSAVHFFSVDGQASDGNYGNDGASGLNAIAIGSEAVASGDYSIAQGYLAQASGDFMVAMGFQAGRASQNVSASNFVGDGSGMRANNVSNSSFVGFYSGYDANNVSRSSFVGDGSGMSANNVSRSSFVGTNSGNDANNVSSSSFVGDGSGMSANNVSRSSFVGFYSGYDANNVSSSSFVGDGSGMNANKVSSSSFVGINSGNNAKNVSSSSFVGDGSGINANNVSNSSFVGTNSGYIAKNVSNSSFVGDGSGMSANNVSRSNFVGTYSGYIAKNVSSSSFVGDGSGMNANKVSRSSFVGTDSGNNANNVSSSSFVGDRSGMYANNVRNGNFMGVLSGAWSQGENNNLLGTASGVGLVGDGNVVLGSSANSLLVYDAQTGLYKDRTGAISLSNPASGLSANNTVALGSLSLSLKDDGVALGSGAIANTDKGVAGYLASGKTDAVWQATLAAVSVGGVDPYDGKNVVNTRQITNVAAGTTLTDAVNVAQLQAAVANIPSLHFLSVQGTATDGNYNNDGASGLNAIAIGTNAIAGGTYGIAIGDSASASEESNIAIGGLAGVGSSGAHNQFIGNQAGSYRSGGGDYNVFSGESAGLAGSGSYNVATGNNAGVSANGDNMVLVGHLAGNSMYGDYNTALGAIAGQDSQGDQNSYVGVASGRNNNGDGNSALGDNAGNRITGNGNVALGQMAGSQYEFRDVVNKTYDRAGVEATGSITSLAVSNTVSVGNLSLSLKDGGVALGSGSIANTDKGVAGYLANGKTDAVWQATLAAVSVGGDDPYDGKNVVNTRQITNVAAGTTLTDAVNVAQLQAATAGLAPLAQTAVLYDSAAKTQVTLGGTGAAPVKLTNLQAATLDANSKDAVTGAQLFATNQTQAAQGNAIAQHSLDLGNQATQLSQQANTISLHTSSISQLEKGWNLSSNGGAATAIKAGDGVNFVNGQNIAITQAGNSISIATTANAVFNQLSVGGMVINSAGIDAKGKTIGNVANAVSGSDVVNLSQLQAATSGLTPLAQTAVLYDSAAKTQVTLGGTGAAPVKLTNLQAATLDANSKDAVTGAQLFATNQTQAAQGNAIAQNSLDIGNQATTLTSHGTQLSQQANAISSHTSSISQLQQGWNLSSNGGAATAIKAGDGVNFANGQNIAITQAGNSISIATTANAVFNQLSVGGMVINSAGINAGGKVISNVGAGAVNANSSDAVTGAQLYQAMQAGGSNSGAIVQLQQGFALQVDGVQAQQVKAGDSVNLQSGKNVSVSQTGTGIEVALADDIQVNSVQVGTVTINQAGINAGGKAITNVGNGILNSDAANMGQLRDLQASFNVQAEKQKFLQVNAAAGAAAANATGDNATAVGVGSQASGSNAVSIGMGSNVSGDNSLSVGTGNEVSGDRSGAVGDPNTVSGNDSYAIGNDNTIAANKSFVVGNNVTIASSASDMSKANGATFQGSVALGDSSTVAAAVGTASTQIRGETYQFAGSKPVGTVSVGSKDAERTLTNVAAGRLDASSTDAVNGSQLFATNQAVEKLQAGAAGVVQYAGTADKNGVNNHAKLVSGDDGVPVRLSNVARGMEATDAVNVQQLNEATNRLERRVNDMEDDANSGIAAAMAVATLGQAYERGQKSVSMGGSVWRGETGYAVGVSSVSEEGSWLFKANGAVSSKGHGGGGVSATYLWH